MEKLDTELIIHDIKKTNFLNEAQFQLDSDWEDYNTLKKALRRGRKEDIRQLIDKDLPVNKKHPVYFACTPLHLAVTLGCTKIVRLLLNKGASVNVKNNNGETPLITAAKMGKTLIMDLLLSSNDELKNCSNKENLSHMHIACMRNKVDIVKKLVQSGARINHAVKLNSLNWPGYTPLHFAVQYQCFETVEFLINCGADITAKDARTLTPLHLADIIQDFTIIDLLLNVHKYEATNPVNSEGLSHFHIACTRNNALVVKNFLKKGVDVNMKVFESSLNWPGYQPINFAIDHECVDVIKLLLTYKAHLNVCDAKRNPIQYAYKTANKVIIKLLLSRNGIRKPEEENSKTLSDFHEACIQQNFIKIRDLLLQENLINKPLELNLPIWTGCTPLHLAIKNSCFKTVKLLLHFGADVTVKDARGKTPLHLAFETKQMDIMDLILSKHINANKNPIDGDCLSHFHIACMRNKIKVIKKFLENGVNINSPVNRNSVFWPGYTSLHFAAQFEMIQVVDLLLQKGADATVKNGMGLTPFDIALVNFDNTCIVNSILTHVATREISNFDDRGFSLLHIHCINNDAKSIEQFLDDQPEDINKRVNWSESSWLGYTPLHFAVHFGNKDAADTLLSRGADISMKNALGNTPLHTVFSFRNYVSEIAHPELLFTSDNPVGDEGYSHFHIACVIGYLEAVEHFLKQGADANEPTGFTGVHEYTRHSPLHLAVGNRLVCHEVVEVLLARGANVAATDAELSTPLHYTKYNRDARAAEALLRHGAEVDPRNMYGETPLYLYARCYDSQYSESADVCAKMQLLLDHGADINAESDEGRTPFTAMDLWPDDARDKVKCLVAMMRHVVRLKIVGARVSEQNERFYLRLLPRLEMEGRYRESDFSRQCYREAEQLGNLHVDKYTTLRDVLLKDVNELALHCRNERFRDLVENPGFRARFPNYHSWLKLQYRRGLKRRPLLEVAKLAMNRLTDFPLPDVCTEKIFKYLDNGDLRSLILTKEEIT